MANRLSTEMFTRLLIVYFYVKIVICKQLI